MTRTSKRMSWTSAISEAWRNLASGTTRPALLASVFIMVVGALAFVDARTVVAILMDSANFRSSGASVRTVEAAEQIDGGRCDVLAGADGIAGSGAFRTVAELRVLRLPNPPVKVFEVTPGFTALIGHQSEVRGTTGVWLSSDLATTLEVSVGDELATEVGGAVVAGVYPYPADGRDPILAYAMLVPVPPIGSFDGCWAEVWPTTASGERLLLYPLMAGYDASSLERGSLNTRLGETFDLAERLKSRPTRLASGAAVVAGLLLGVGSARARRLEFASALHARVPRTALAWQVAVETIAWSAAAVMIVGVVLVWGAGVGNPDPDLWPTWVTGIRTVSAGASGLITGAVGGVIVTREAHLFRYFRER